MVTNIIIAIVVIVTIVAATIILKWIQEQKLIKLVDKVFELLINPSIHYLNIKEGKTKIAFGKSEIKIRGEIKNQTFKVTRWYKIAITREERRELTLLTVYLIDKSDHTLYQKYAEMNKW